MMMAMKVDKKWKEICLLMMKKMVFDFFFEK